MPLTKGTSRRPRVFCILVLLLSGCGSTLSSRVAYLEDTRNMTAAEELLVSTTTAEPGNHEAQFLLGRILFENKDYARGVAAFEASIRASTRYEEEIQLITARHLNEAVQAGNAAMELSDWGEAATQFAFATEIDSDRHEFWDAYGTVLALNGQRTDAESAFHRSLSLDPNSPVALNNLAELALRRNDFDRCIEFAERLLATGIRSDAANLKIFYAALGKGNLDRADTAFRAIALKDRMLYHNQIVANFNANALERAATSLEQLAGTPIDYESSGIYSIVLSEVYYRQREYDDMARVLRPIVDQFSADLNARRSLIMAYDLIGFEAEARQQREALYSILSQTN